MGGCRAGRGARREGASGVVMVAAPAADEVGSADVPHDCGGKSPSPLFDGANSCHAGPAPAGLPTVVSAWATAARAARRARETPSLDDAIVLNLP